MVRCLVGFNVCVLNVLHQCHQLNKVYTPHLISLKQVWIWCSSLSNGRTDVNNKQQSALPRISIMDGNRCHADAHFREDRCFKLIHIALELGSFFSVANNTAHNQLGYRKMYACQVLNTLTDNQKACHGIWCVCVLLPCLTRPRQVMSCWDKKCDTTECLIQREEKWILDFCGET